MDHPKILVFAASTREDSFHRKLARLAAETLTKLGANFTFADLRDYPMPIYDGDLEASHGLPERAKAFKELVRAHDAFVIASPEYNGSFSALVKNTIDWASRPEPGEKSNDAFRGKTAVLLASSPGPGAGKRGLKHLRELLQMIGVNVVAQELAVPKAFEGFSTAGRLVRDEDISRLEVLLAGLVNGAATAA
jgi:NAD(P)H-dependent FMN reductase